MITFCSKLLVVISKIYCSKIYFVTYHLFIMLLSWDLLLNYKPNHIKVCSYNHYRLQYYICCTFDPQFFSISISFFSKGQVSFCHHFASIVCPLSVVNFNNYIFSETKLYHICGDGPLSNLCPTALHSRWQLLLKMKISFIVYCYFIVNQNELKA